MNDDLMLLPVPREIRRGEGASWRPSGMPLLETTGGPAEALDRVAERVASGLRRHVGGGEPSTKHGAIRLEIRAGTDLPAEGFELEVDARGVRLVAGDARGLGWGAGALDQLLRQRGADLPPLRIRDFPDFPVRGYMLDVSRDRVPTQDTLELLVELLADLRINQLQLYTEHTFAYSGHETVWRDASPMTPDEIRQLDDACAARGIELVPNQNSFGHMERWLAHDEYRHLGERPEGGRTLAPGDESLIFMRDLYAQLLPCFRSRTLNIDCDETFDLGQGKSHAACEERGRGRVYLEFVLELMRGLHADGHHVQFWGDIIAQYPELIAELPDKGITALAWGYEAPSDPDELPKEIRAFFERHADLNMLRGFETTARPFAESGVPFYVCPGTSSWNSAVGRLDNALDNLRDAAHAGLAHGACGFLITDWGDNGHLQPPSVSLPPLAFGAAISWCASSAADLDLARALDTLVLRDATGHCAGALLRLGSAYSATGLHSLNASPAFSALLRPLGAKLLSWGETSAERIEGLVATLDEARATLARAQPEGFGGALVARELRQAAGLLRHGAWRLARGTLGHGPSNDELRRDLDALIEEQAGVWRERSREGGLRDSLARLENARADYESD